MPQVKCSISNCDYWGNNNNCNADVIMIASDQHSNAKFNEEFAGENFDSNHQDIANDSASTCCHTFKPKKA